MKDRDRCNLALMVLCGVKKVLDADEIEALGIPQTEHASTNSLVMMDGDFCWRGKVNAGPLKESPMKVDPVEVSERVAAVLLEYLERSGAFRCITKKK